MRLGRVVKYLRQYAKFYSLIMVTFAILLCTHMFGCIFVACINPCGQYEYDYYTGELQPCGFFSFFVFLLSILSFLQQKKKKKKFIYC